MQWLIFADPYRRLVLTLTIPFSPLPETTQMPMNPPRKAAQAALLPRLHRRWLLRRAAAAAATQSRIAAAALPPHLQVGGESNGSNGSNELESNEFM